MRTIPQRIPDGQRHCTRYNLYLFALRELSQQRKETADSRAVTTYNLINHTAKATALPR
jgi:hypothetical protein